MKTKLKSVVALAFAAVLCGFALAADKVTATAIIKDVVLRQGSAPYETGITADSSQWEPIVADSKVANTNLVAGNKFGIVPSQYDGETKIILKWLGAKDENTNRVFNVKVATIEMTKNVVNVDQNSKTATIQIDTHYLAGRPKVSAKAFFLGTACSSHSEGKETADKQASMLKAMTNAINGVATKASVDYKFYYDSGSTGNPNWKDVNGVVQQGSVVTGISNLKSVINNGNHAAMEQFYETLADLADNHREEYDYIILEFDGNLLGGSESTHTTYEYDEEREEKVAKFLQRYYDLGRIFWVVNGWQESDPNPPTKLGDLDQLLDSEYFRPVQYAKGLISDATSGRKAQFWQGLLGLLNPDLYLKYDTVGSTLPTITTNIVFQNKSSQTVTAKVGHPITGGIGNEEEIHWTTYTDADKIGAALQAFLREVKLEAVVSDRVNTNLTVVDGVDGVSFKHKDSKNGQWKTGKIGDVAVGTEFDLENNLVKGTVTNLTQEWWTRLEVKVKDNGFLTQDTTVFWFVSNSVDKVAYFFDPNVSNDNPKAIGPALTVEYDLSAASKPLYSETNAWTGALWKFDLGKLTLTPTGVDRDYNGKTTNATVVVKDEKGKVVEPDKLKVCYDPSGAGSWEEPVDYDKDAFKNVTNLCVKFIAEKEGYLTTTSGSVRVSITPLTIYVEGVDTNKVYSSDDPNPLPYKYDLSNVVAGEGTTVSNLLNENKGSFGRVAGEDVNDDGYSITNETPFYAGVNYKVEYRNAMLTINKKDIVGAVATYYVGLYNGTSNTIGLVVGDQDLQGNRMQVQFSRTGTSGPWSGKYPFGEHGGVLTNAYGAINCVEEMPVYVKVLGPKDHEGNYNTTNLSATVTIMRRPVTVKALDASKKFGEKDPKPWKWDLDFTDKKKTDIVEGEQAKVYEALTNDIQVTEKLDRTPTGESAGSYTITTNAGFKVMTTGVLQNYCLGFEEGAFTISGGKVTVTAQNYQRKPGDPNPTDTKIENECEVDPASLKGEIKYTATCTYKGDEPGEHKGVIVPSGAAVQGDYSVTYVAGNLKIEEKVPLKIFVDDCTVMYGDAVPTNSLAFKTGAERYDRTDVDEKKISGLDKVKFGTTYYQNAPVSGNDYTINTNSADLSSVYYDITVVPGKLTVLPRPIEITAASAVWPYDGKEHSTNGWSVTQGSFVPGEGLEVVTMTPDSRITNHGETNNVIATMTPKPNTDLGNYVITKKHGLLMVSSVQVYGEAKDVIKMYDGELTNITVTVKPEFAGCEIWYAADPAQTKEDEKRTLLMMATAGRPADAPPEELFKKGVNPRYRDVCNRNKVWYKIVDPSGNYSNYYGFAHITIVPRPVQFRFPRAEKPYDGTTAGGPLLTNLVGEADNMVGLEKFTCTGTGSFVSAAVGAGGAYFRLESVKIDASRNAFFRNYTIKYWADGDYNELTVPEENEADPSYTFDGDKLPKKGTDGEITPVPMEIGDVPQPSEPGKQIPVDPEDPASWTNGALSVWKVYDAVPTNIVVNVTKPASYVRVRYSYERGGRPVGDWKAYEDFAGYVNVTNAAPVWFLAEDPNGNYLPVTNRAFVTIVPAPILDVTEETDPTVLETNAWALAVNTVVWTNDCHEVTVVGTNIAVRTRLLTAEDTAKAVLRYSTVDPAVAEPSDWSDSLALKEICNRQVWCNVSCENYLPTNVTAYVAILSRESEVVDDGADGKDKPLPNPKTDAATDSVLSNIIVNAEFTAAGDPNPEYDPAKPGWKAGQIDGHVYLAFTSITNLPAAERSEAEKHLAETAKAYTNEHASVRDFEIRSVDVRLAYTQTFQDSSLNATNFIGGTNEELIPFTLSVDLSKNREVLQVTRYHDGKVLPLEAPEGYVVVRNAEDPGNSAITITAKRYSEFIIVTGVNLVPLKIFVADKAVTYGDAVPADLGFKTGAERYECAETVDESKIAGLTNVTFATSYTRYAPAGGDYSINTNSAALSSAYYDITVVPGVLTVGRKAVTVSPDANQARCAGDPETGIAWTATGVVNGDPKVTGAFAREKGEAVGTYTINLAEDFSYGANYDVTVINYGPNAPAAYKYTIESCACGETCPWGYKVKLVVRTTAAQNVTNRSSSVCGCFRKPAMRRYIGYFFGRTAQGVGVCGKGTCGCVDLSDPDAVLGYVAMWNFDTKKAATPAVDLELLNRIGYRDTSKAEVVFSAKNAIAESSAQTYLKFAGFGSVQRRADGSPALKDASGFCAGTVPGLCSSCSESICGSPVECETTAVNVWKICSERLDVSNVMTTYVTAAYGKWAMEWDAAIVNRIANGRVTLGESGETTSGFTPTGYEKGVAERITFESNPYGEVDAD